MTMGSETTFTVQTGNRNNVEGAPSGRRLMGNGQRVGHDKGLSWLEEGAMKE